MSKRWTVILLCAIVLCTGVRVQVVDARSFFRRQGRDILDRNGEPFLIRGIALSGWLTQEAYMLKLNAVHNRHIGSQSDLEIRIRDLLGTDTDAQEFWDTYHANFLRQDDLAEIAAAGFNTVRIPFNYRLVSPWGTPGEYSEEGFEVLDRVIQWAKNEGLYVILEMHSAPGGQSHDPPADPEYTYWMSDTVRHEWIEVGVPCLWEYNQEYYDSTGRDPQFNKRRTADIWRTIANRYKDEEWIIGYELINEPYLPYGIHSPDLRNLLVQITTAIREVDVNHIIFAEGNFYASTFEGLMPPWDSNMALMFHKYWEPTEYETIRQYVETAATYNLPLVMSESGLNSNPWYYEFVQLLESHNIGWVWWGYKEVDAITAGYSASITSDYQYVIDNFRDLPVDPVRIKRGLMDLANNVLTANCHYNRGNFASLLDPQFNLSPQPYTNHEIPGIIHCVDYDIGNQNIAYWDTSYKNEAGYNGNAWNAGWQYRNDGVDIWKTNDSDPFSIGYYVGGTEDNEWMKYTIHVRQGGVYKLSFRVAGHGGEFQLLLDGNNLTGIIGVPDTGGYENWVTQVHNSHITLPVGTHVLELRIITGNINLSYLRIDTNIIYCPAIFRGG